MIQRNFQPGAHAHVQLKDLLTANELAHELAMKLSIAPLVEQLFADMCLNGRDSLDHSGLFLEIQERCRRG
jgi:2-hydroxy-3-oxopropionate reductase